MIRVRVPATTANLGPGFDCMGLALDLWNTFELHPNDSQRISVETHGEGALSLPTDDTNLVAAVMLQELGCIKLPPGKGYHIVCHNTIPPASGLGSSSTAVLAGILFAKAVEQDAQGLDPSDIDLTGVLSRAVELEGHGDNVAPALLGGFVIVVPDRSGVLTQRIPHVPLKTVVCVPDFCYLTSEARASLPNSYTKADAIFNIGRAMLVAESLRQGNDELLARAMDDRIHEPYRLGAIPGATAALQAASTAGAICACLSGAGPGLIAFARDGFDRIGRAMKLEFARHEVESRYWLLEATDQGVRVTRLPT